MAIPAGFWANSIEFSRGTKLKKVSVARPRERRGAARPAFVGWWQPNEGYIEALSVSVYLLLHNQLIAEARREARKMVFVSLPLPNGNQALSELTTVLTLSMPRLGGGAR